MIKSSWGSRLRFRFGESQKDAMVSGVHKGGLSKGGLSNLCVIIMLSLLKPPLLNLPL